MALKNEIEVNNKKLYKKFISQDPMTVMPTEKSHDKKKLQPGPGSRFKMIAYSGIVYSVMPSNSGFG